jgi:hypothetical protein
MASIVSLQQIPTLRELYQRGAIAAHPQIGGAAADSGGGGGGGDRETQFPVSSPFLDRVSV